MAKFAVFFTFTGQTVKALMDHPSDRAAVVSNLCEAAGGRMESYYLMFGPWDGFVIAEVPDSKSAAAISLAVSSSGAFGRIETHELVEGVVPGSAVFARCARLAADAVDLHRAEGALS